MPLSFVIQGACIVFRPSGTRGGRALSAPPLSVTHGCTRHERHLAPKVPHVIRLRRLAIGVGLVLLLVAAGLAAAATLRWREVVTQRRDSALEAARVRANETLSVDDACWLAKDWFHHGAGRAGRRPLVDCRGPLDTVPGGVRLAGVTTQSELLQGRHVRGLCLVRGAEWEVLGDDWTYRDCRGLPVVGGAVAVAAAVRAETNEAVARARRAILASLPALDRAPDTCPPGLTIDPERLVTADASHLSADDRSGPGVVPHSLLFLACTAADAGVDERTADFLCGTGAARSWTHALVHRLELNWPEPHADHTFTGGRATGLVAVVELSTSTPLCQAPVDVSLPQKVWGRRGTLEAEVRLRFSELVADGVTQARHRLLGPGR